MMNTNNSTSTRVSNVNNCRIFSFIIVVLTSVLLSAVINLDGECLDCAYTNEKELEISNQREENRIKAVRRLTEFLLDYPILEPFGAEGIENTVHKRGQLIMQYAALDRCLSDIPGEFVKYVQQGIRLYVSLYLQHPESSVLSHPDVESWNRTAIEILAPLCHHQELIFEYVDLIMEYDALAIYNPIVEALNVLEIVPYYDAVNGIYRTGPTRTARIQVILPNMHMGNAPKLWKWSEETQRGDYFLGNTSKYPFSAHQALAKRLTTRQCTIFERYANVFKDAQYMDDYRTFCVPSQIGRDDKN